MNIPREQIYSALFSLLQSAASFKTVGRVWMPAAKLSPPQLPALFLVEREETAIQSAPGRPAKWILGAEIHLYARNEGETQIPGQETVLPVTALNNLLDAIEIVLKPSAATNVQSLGGLVQHCWIEGKMKKDAALQGAVSIAVVPVKLLTTS